MILNQLQLELISLTILPGIFNLPQISTCSYLNEEQHNYNHDLSLYFLISGTALVSDNWYQSAMKMYNQQVEGRFRIDRRIPYTFL